MTNNLGDLEREGRPLAVVFPTVKGAAGFRLNELIAEAAISFSLYQVGLPLFTQLLLD